MGIRAQAGAWFVIGIAAGVAKISTTLADAISVAALVSGYRRVRKARGRRPWRSGVISAIQATLRLL